MQECRIICKDHIVRSWVESYVVNGKVIQRPMTEVKLKSPKARSKAWDILVFKAIHIVGHKWEDLQNHFENYLGSQKWHKELERAIDRHSI